MIQRVQTLYLSMAFILLVIVATGVTFFSYVADGVRYSFDAFGITHANVETGELIGHTDTFAFIGIITLGLMCVATVLSYKALDRQLKTGRILFFLYFLAVIGVVLASIMGDKFLGVEAGVREMGLGFVLFIAGFPFTFLANLGIKRDKRVLDSLDRLR